MKLKEFQLKAVKDLFEAMDEPNRDIILKSPTGSGKTIILTYFMHQYIQSYSLHRVKETLRNRVRKKWINISTLHKPSSFLM